jgi:TetR/AcrR family transcriptional regulator, repressor of fatR-cypB operon
MERMTAKPKPNKRDAILNAMLDVVAERGFHEAPMSLIAERSGASAGVIYHHFASKEAIIQALYERVRELKRASLLAGYPPDIRPPTDSTPADSSSHRLVIPQTRHPTDSSS